MLLRNRTRLESNMIICGALTTIFLIVPWIIGVVQIIKASGVLIARLF